MTRVLALGAVMWLAGCGLDGPPIRPAPDPAPPAPQSGVVIGGSGYIGGMVSR